jgi:V8-like Glu-specific endopeptidase
MILLILPLLSQLASANPKVIYGEDNRRDVYAETNPLFKKIALSTAALVDHDNLQTQGSQVLVSGRSLKDIFKMCDDQRFKNQPVAAHCSGTLIAPDIIMTAGHCYDSGNNECKNSSWVFDYKASKENQGSVLVPEASVYHCAEVITMINDPFNNADHALIRLDRAVTGRDPIKLQKTPVKINDEVLLIGHPLGLPTKIADGAKVTKVDAYSFLTNTDSFTINSGSGLFNPKTGEAIGILSSGARDLETKNGCSVNRVLKMEDAQEMGMRLEQVVKALP